MEYIRLGSTQLRISRICLGCMSYGSPGWINWDWVLEEQAAEPFFRRAIELGINFFDTADSYSNGRSEEITGHWLKKYARRDDIVIATKHFFGPEETVQQVQQACEASLKRLGVEVIDLYQIHRLMPGASIETALTALDNLVRQGKVRHVGASSMYAWKFMQALGLSDRKGMARFVSMENLYNLLYREEERDMVPLCEAEGVGMIPWSPLARGTLARADFPEEKTNRSEEDPYVGLFHTPADREIITQVALIAAQRGIKSAQVALAWLLSKPAVAAPIVGASKLSHLEDAAAAVELQLTADEIKALERPYQPKPHLGITPPFRMPPPGAVHDRLTTE
jgi:aryl-alcohol dehydrogenase-like predicted oxidoreductase